MCSHLLCSTPEPLFNFFFRSFICRTRDFCEKLKTFHYANTTQTEKSDSWWSGKISFLSGPGPRTLRYERVAPALEYDFKFYVKWGRHLASTSVCMTKIGAYCDIVPAEAREMWSHVFHFLFCSAINHTQHIFLAHLPWSTSNSNLPNEMRNKTLRDCSINTSRIEIFHFLHFFLSPCARSIIQFGVSAMLHFCAAKPNVLMNESWSHVGSQLTLFAVSLPLSASKFNELLIEARWVRMKLRAETVESFESLRPGELRFLSPLGDQILLLDFEALAFVVVYFGFSVEAIIFQ